MFGTTNLQVSKTSKSLLLSREAARARAFFNDILKGMVRFQNGRIIVVAHILDDRPPFFEAIEEIAPIGFVIPKPSSIDDATLTDVSKRWPVEHVDRRVLTETRGLEIVAKHIEDRPFIALDIGGYFSGASKFLNDSFPKQFLGVVEGTKNGAARYIQHPPAVPVVNVADSGIKKSEAFPVAVSIVFSAGAILREAHETFARKTALVIGFGDVGSSIAHLLRNSVKRVLVVDVSPVKQAEALSHDFDVPPLKEALVEADLVFCATGNRALTASHFWMLKDGAFVFCVTSADDELDPDALARLRSERVNRSITAYFNSDATFFLANDGRAVNFLHGAEVRPFIRAVQGMFLAGVDHLVRHRDAPGVISLHQETEDQVARIFMQHFRR